MDFQHVALGGTESVSHIACLHGDQQSLFVCCVGGMNINWQFEITKSKPKGV